MNQLTKNTYRGKRIAEMNELDAVLLGSPKVTGMVRATPFVLGVMCMSNCHCQGKH
ncbi:hypothetical protein SOV_02360 [Sporomusa ovata DSM 2662]|nr:hypothetical protein SOV_2c08280 [Sporomusa ovata DSM 2662]